MGIDQINFCDFWNRIAEHVHNTAKSKGWWNGHRNDGELIALIHSELSEALEAIRTGDKLDTHIPEFHSVETELADVVIRIMDMAKARGYNVAEALCAKMIFNETRPFKHGGKVF